MGRNFKGFIPDKRDYDAQGRHVNRIDNRFSRTHLPDGRQFFDGKKFRLFYDRGQMMALRAALEQTAFPVDGIADPEIPGEVMWGVLYGFKAALRLGIVRSCFLDTADAYKIAKACSWGFDAHALVLCYVQNYKILDDIGAVIKYPTDWIVYAAYQFWKYREKASNDIVKGRVSDEAVSRVKAYDDNHLWFPGVYNFNDLLYTHNNYLDTKNRWNHFELITNLSTEPFSHFETMADKAFNRFFRTYNGKKPLSEIQGLAEKRLKDAIYQKAASEDEARERFDKERTVLKERFEYVADKWDGKYFAFADPEIFGVIYHEYNYGDYAVPPERVEYNTPQLAVPLFMAEDPKFLAKYLMANTYANGVYRT